MLIPRTLLVGSDGKFRTGVSERMVACLSKAYPPHVGGFRRFMAELSISYIMRSVQGRRAA